MDQYFYLDADNQQKGPIAPNDFLRTGITRHTLVWQAGMAGWQAAGNIPELSGYFQPVPPPPPAYASAHEGGAASPYQTVAETIPGAVPPASSRPSSQKPDNWLVWSILSTVLCCIPAGIVAIVYSNKVDKLWYEGDYGGAFQAAQNAKTACIVALILGFFTGPASLLFWLL